MRWLLLGETPRPPYILHPCIPDGRLVNLGGVWGVSPQQLLFYRAILTFQFFSHHNSNKNIQFLIFFTNASTKSLYGLWSKLGGSGGSPPQKFLLYCTTLITFSFNLFLVNFRFGTTSLFKLSCVPLYCKHPERPWVTLRGVWGVSPPEIIVPLYNAHHL
jgi:hypothetical protein